MINNKKLVYTIFISLIFCLSFLMQQPLNVSSASTDNAVDIDLIILDAYYGDFDGDRLFDDVRILLKIDIQFAYYLDDESINAILKIDIFLPSGLKYKGVLKFSTEYEGNDIFVLITALNTATESGWYETEIDSIITFDKNTYTPSDDFIFDPPTDGGSGSDPLFSLTVM